MAGNLQYGNSVKIRLGTCNIGTLDGKGLEICDELWKRNIDLCRLQEVRWRGCGARQIGSYSRMHKLQWSESQEGHDGVGVPVKEELYDTVVEVIRVNDRLSKVLQGEVVRANTPQS